MSFVDDLIGLEGSVSISNEECVNSEVFERKTRMKYKVPKCKVITMNSKQSDVVLNGEVLENVKEQVYLGTIISANGERFSEMNSRLTKANSVVNEIIQICNNTELSNIRLRYVKLLMNSCLDSKIKYGCALWNVTKLKGTSEKLNRIKPGLLKKVLQVPNSTPTAALQYEFGITDLALDVLMEKVILGVQTLKCDDVRISKQILESLLRKNVPGFCTELKEACDIFEVSMESLINASDVRHVLKEKVIKIQETELMKRMVGGSKMDGVILEGFVFNGKMKKYLTELNFEEARGIFMARYRMWPTKVNYPGRWNGVSCNVCGFDDTDIHLFTCPGYSDIVNGQFNFYSFWDNDTLEDMGKLKMLAKIVLLLLERMKHIQKFDN